MEKTALVICTRKYFDIQLNRLVFRLEELEVNVKRSRTLIKEKVCELKSIK